MKKRLPIFLSILLIGVMACSDRAKNSLIYTVTRKNFENYVVIDGFAEPMLATSVVCPRAGGGGTIAFLVEEGAWVEEGDTVCTIENKNMQTHYDQLLTNLENAEAEIVKTKANLTLQLAMLEADAKNNEAETQIAHLDSTSLRYLSPNQRLIRELELEIVAINRRRIESKLVSMPIIQQSEVRKLELQIQRLENNVASVKKDLDELVLRSPKKGLVIRGTNPMTSNKFAVGDPVWNGMQLVTIPEMNAMKMKIFASERDYRYIEVGDSVSYVFDALEENVAWGKILNKMPVGVEVKRGSQIKHFEMEASIDSTLVMPDPGFTATCHIWLKQVKDTLVVPQVAVFEHDSIRVVYVETKKGFEMREVRIGQSSPKEAVVTGGLVGDEKVALAKPRAVEVRSIQLMTDSIID